MKGKDAISTGPGAALRILTTGMFAGACLGAGACVKLGIDLVFAVIVGCLLTFPVSLAVIMRSGKSWRTPDTLARDGDMVMAAGPGWAVAIPAVRLVERGGAAVDRGTGKRLFAMPDMEPAEVVRKMSESGTWARFGARMETVALVSVALSATLFFLFRQEYAYMGVVHGVIMSVWASRKAALASGPFAELDGGKLTLRPFFGKDKTIEVAAIREIGLRWQGVGGLDRGVPFIRTDSATHWFSWFEGAAGDQAADFVRTVSRSMTGKDPA